MNYLTTTAAHQEKKRDVTQKMTQNQNQETEKNVYKLKM